MVVDLHPVDLADRRDPHLAAAASAPMRVAPMYSP